MRWRPNRTFLVLEPASRVVSIRISYIGRATGLLATSRNEEGVAETTYVGCLVRLERGPFRSGATYIISVTPDGSVFVNARNMATGADYSTP